MCNHIICRCRKNFCYYCGQGFKGQDECYKHMDEEKHWEEAPDYFKYIKNEVISFEKLESFYVKYPKWRQSLSKSDDDNGDDDEDEDEEIK